MSRLKEIIEEHLEKIKGSRYDYILYNVLFQYENEMKEIMKPTESTDACNCKPTQWCINCYASKTDMIMGYTKPHTVCPICQDTDIYSSGSSGGMGGGIDVSLCPCGIEYERE